MRHIILLFQVLVAFYPTIVSSDPLTYLESYKNRIDPHLKFLRLAAETSDINTVLNGTFEPLGEKKPNFGFQEDTYWFRLPLKLPLNTKEEFFLILDYPLLDEVEFFYLENGIVKSSLLSGDLQPFDSRSYHFRLINFKIPFSSNSPTNESVVLFRVKTSSSMQVGGRIMSYREMAELKSEESTIFGIYYGGMIVLFLYHLILFFILREKIYIFFCMFIFTFFTGQMTLTGIFFHWITPTLPILSNLFLSPLLFFSISSMTIFQKIFLGTSERPIFNQTLKYMGLVLFLLAITSLFLPYKVSIRLIVTVAIIVPGVLLTYAILRLKDGFKPARYYLLGWALFLIGCSVYAFKTIAILPTNLITEYIMQIGSFVQIIFFSIALADRINTIQDEKTLAQKDAVSSLKKVNRLKDEWTANLELQVKERTKNLEDALEKIQESENTLINQNKEIEAITEAAIEVQKSSNRSSIVFTLGKFLENRFKIPILFYYTADENRNWIKKESYGINPNDSKMKAFSIINSLLCDEVSKHQEVIFFRYEKELGEFTKVATKKSNMAIVDEEHNEEVDWEMGKIDISLEDGLEIPSFFIGIPVPFQSKIMGILVCTSDFQSLTHVPVSPDLLGRLSRLLAGPIYLGEKQLKYIRELQKSQKDLELSKSQLTQAEKMSSLGQMVAGISHEIANPINYIGAARANLDKQIQNLRDEIISQADEEDEESREALKAFQTKFNNILEGLADIERGVQKVTEINRAMANFSRLDTDKQENISLPNLVGEAIVILSHKLKNIQVEKQFDEDLKISCHPSQISQVIMNLLSNACDAILQITDDNTKNQDKKILISIQNPTNSKESVELVVEDSGPGIPLESRKKIFDAFYTTKPIGVGTGLGLAVTGNIIKKHKGKISIGSSSKLGGAKFRVIFPQQTGINE